MSGQVATGTLITPGSSHLSSFEGVFLALAHFQLTGTNPPLGFLQVSCNRPKTGHQGNEGVQLCRCSCRPCGSQLVAVNQAATA